ncbi:hypothetical protein NDU88_003373 [Pleurodeles waltl]|uniref:Ubiquitin-like domain-containing protein n=1 Tax=Pleurodeles waltl TaxID=8319 RepID=A0AAV7LMW2_PLEWA|nr:hypothetical protein NDU88_003373 [Pleurodeles waltl]
MCRGSCQVLLNSPGGNGGIIDVASSTEDFRKTTLRKFKQLVVERIQAPNLGIIGNEDVGFMFRSKQLEEEKTFAYYGIKPMSTIVMVVRLPGG